MRAVHTCGEKLFNLEMGNNSSHMGSKSCTEKEKG